MPSSEVSIERLPAPEGTVILRVVGDLDLGAAPTLKWALTDEVRSGAVHLVLDLSAVRFMDSTALGVLVGVERSLEPGCRLSLAALGPDVRMTFEVTGLDSAFRIFAGVQEALADFRAEPASSEDRAQSS